MAAGVDVADIERLIARLEGVSRCRAVLADDGAPVEVHVIADGAKPPKQLVRDVQSVALAGLGVSLDHRIVSVVTIPGGLSAFDAPPAADALADGRAERDLPDAHVAPRVCISGLGVHVSAERTTVDITLRMGTAEAAGAAFGPPTPRLRHRLVASAASQALERLFGASERLLLDAVEVISLGARRVAVVTLVVAARSGEELMSGISVAEPGDEDAAVARAVLDATNRRLPFLFPALDLG